jgi:holo-[acyl-carrier protein] synthase
VYLYGRAKARAERIGLSGLDVSLSHSREYAVAFVVGQSNDLEPERERWREKLIDILRERGMLE